MSRPKEAGYHARDLNMTEAIWDRNEYLALFDDAGSSALRGDATPWYLFSQRAAASIQEMSPDAKIVVHLRDPVEVLSSLHNHHVYVGIERETDFRTAVLGGPRRRASDDFRDGLDYLAVARLGEQVARYAELFPRNQIFTVRFDELVAHPKLAYHDLLVRMGLAPVPLDAHAHLNPARRHRSSAVDRFLSALQKMAERSRGARALHSRLDRLNTAQGRVRPDAALRDEIFTALAPDIELLGSLLDVDLSSWNATRAA